MRWWDVGARVRVALAGLNAAALGLVLEGWGRGVGCAAAVLAMLLIIRSFHVGRPPGSLILPTVPSPAGALYLGRGFEWSLEAAQETLETGRAAIRGERDLLLPDRLAQQHLLVLGTTGTGKTRLLEVLVLQAIARGDAVIVVDPKGDQALVRRVRAAAGSRFRLFSLPHPEQSVTYNPVGRFQDVREVADRVAAMLPGTGDALPFRNYAWDVVYTTARELEGRKPITLRNLRRHAIDRPIGPLARRPREHHLKLVSALGAALAKLSNPVLSPEKGGLSWETVDAHRQVVYLSLGSLLGGESAGAVAKMALLDIQGYVGARYAYSKGSGPVWLFVDELGDVVTEQFVSLLNKSRGAGLRVVACGQTAADLEAALGSRAKALQVLGNASTIIQFRAQSSADAAVFSELSGERLLQVASDSVAYEPALFGSGWKGVDDFRARFGEARNSVEHALVPPWALVQLPVFHFFARWEGRVFTGRVPLLA